jgi:hypothetical protein
MLPRCRGFNTVDLAHELQTPNEAFFIGIPNFGAWQTIWADKFWGI